MNRLKWAALYRSETLDERIIDLPLGAVYIHQQSSNAKETNSAVEAYYQVLN